MDVLRCNLELKARDPDPAASLAAALALGARDEGVLRRATRTFAAPRCRLKLREQEPGGAQLIAYDRADVGAARESRYRLVEVPDPEALRAALDAALGTTNISNTWLSSTRRSCYRARAGAACRGSAAPAARARARACSASPSA